jgi:hypothetical protein
MPAARLGRVRHQVTADQPPDAGVRQGSRVRWRLPADQQAADTAPAEHFEGPLRHGLGRLTDGDEPDGPAGRTRTQRTTHCPASIHGAQHRRLELQEQPALFAILTHGGRS